jgi:hypothetical protein
MKQAIAGVAPADLEEVTVMDNWPSISAYWSGRNILGWLYNIQFPGVYIFRLGNLFALLSIPHALALYFYRLLPSVFGSSLHGSWYRLTNRRVVELYYRLTFVKGRIMPRLVAHVAKSVDLDRFNTIDLVVQPGQDWFDAGDLIFKQNGVETFRLAGVSRPEPFRMACLHGHRAFVGVKQATQRQAVPA